MAEYAGTNISLITGPNTQVMITYGGNDIGLSGSIETLAADIIKSISSSS